METYSDLAEDIEIFLSESQLSTVEEKVSAIFHIFERCLPYSDTPVILDIISNAAKKLGLRSSEEVISKEYLDFLLKQKLPNLG